jgi:putative copper export protein
MKAWLIIINNFVHDLFTGLWISAILVIYLLGKKAGLAQGTPLASSLQEVMKVFFWLGVFSILIIVVTGIIRLREYKFQNRGAAEPLKKKILLLKHILFGAIFLGGTYLAYIRAFY